MHGSGGSGKLTATSSGERASSHRAENFAQQIAVVFHDVRAGKYNKTIYSRRALLTFAAAVYVFGVFRELRRLRATTSLIAQKSKHPLLIDTARYMWLLLFHHRHSWAAAARTQTAANTTSAATSALADISGDLDIVETSLGGAPASLLEFRDYPAAVVAFGELLRTKDVLPLPLSTTLGLALLWPVSSLFVRTRDIFELLSVGFAMLFSVLRLAKASGNPKYHKEA